MIKILQFLWHGCWHKWGTPLGHVDHYDITFGHRSFMYRAHTVRCDKCGRYGVLKDRGGGS